MQAAQLQTMRSALDFQGHHSCTVTRTKQLETWRAMKRSLLWHFHLSLEQDLPAKLPFQQTHASALIKLTKLMHQSSRLQRHLDASMKLRCDVQETDKVAEVLDADLVKDMAADQMLLTPRLRNGQQ